MGDAISLSVHLSGSGQNHSETPVQMKIFTGASNNHTESPLQMKIVTEASSRKQRAFKSLNRFQSQDRNEKQQMFVICEWLENSDWIYFQTKRTSINLDDFECQISNFRKQINRSTSFEFRGARGPNVKLAKMQTWKSFLEIRCSSRRFVSQNDHIAKD